MYTTSVVMAMDLPSSSVAKSRLLACLGLQGAVIVGIGVDIEQVASFRAKPFAEHEAFYRRLFSPAEIDYCCGFQDMSERFAARFCAKEALVKALGEQLKMTVTQAEVGHNTAGCPIILARQPSTPLADFLIGHDIWLSLSHTSDYAIAMVVVSKSSQQMPPQTGGISGP